MQLCHRNCFSIGWRETVWLFNAWKIVAKNAIYERAKFCANLTLFEVESILLKGIQCDNLWNYFSGISVWSVLRGRKWNKKQTHHFAGNKEAILMVIALFHVIVFPQTLHILVIMFQHYAMVMEWDYSQEYFLVL